MTASSRYTRAISSEVGDIERFIERSRYRGRFERSCCVGFVELGGSLPPERKLPRRSICYFWQRRGPVWDRGAESNLKGNRTSPAHGSRSSIGRWHPYRDGNSQSRLVRSCFVRSCPQTRRCAAHADSVTEAFERPRVRGAVAHGAQRDASRLPQK
jgi:hypothetical protein